MTDPGSWHEENSRDLSTAIAWVRARLQAYSENGQASLALVALHPPTKEEPKSFWRRLLRSEPAHPASQTTTVLLPTAGSASVAESVAQATAHPATVGMETGPAPALILLSRQLGLSQFEQEVLLLCAAMELDTGIAALCARAQSDPARPYPTFALALTLFDEPSWDALSPERPLRYWRLVEIHQPAGQPLTVSPLRADERIVNYLKGLNYLDDRLAPLISPLDLAESQAEAPPSERTAVETIIGHLKQVSPGQSLPVIQLLGNDSPSKQVVAGAVARALGLRVYRLSWGLVPSQSADLETFVRLWQRESMLLPVALYLEVQAAEGEAAPISGVNRLLGRIGGLTFLDTREVWPGLAQPTLPIDVSKPSPAEQQAAWIEALGEAAGASPALLAGQFNLNLASIREIARRALSEPAADGHAPHRRLWDACLAETRPRLDAMAQRIDPKATWDDIVLPPAETGLLHQIGDQVGQRSTVYQAWGFANKMSRGLGISVLFAGESGTGKTMAAEVLANDLRLNLHRIDLSAVVSKYIGETEKNLRRLFDAAEDGGTILFFDEADALFGKRSEVKDSHDRYANIEINYLLQRMEAYRGLAILATNMKSALDPAFLRRLRFVVKFPFPGVVERKAIWQRVFPRETPTAGLDFDRLARLNVTGGHIHAIALNAAFMAAEAGTSVTMPLVLEAAQTEFRKLERPINEADFRWQAPASSAA